MYCVKLILVDENLWENYSYFTQMISAQFLLWNVLLGGELQIDAKWSRIFLKHPVYEI